MDNSSKVMTYAAAFATVAGGALMLACIVPVMGIRGIQKATILHLTADSHRMISLARTYDVRAAVQALKTLSGTL
jgi:hypothetical protein